MNPKTYDEWLEGVKSDYILMEKTKSDIESFEDSLHHSFKQYYLTQDERDYIEENGGIRAFSRRHLVVRQSLERIWESLTTKK